MFHKFTRPYEIEGPAWVERPNREIMKDLLAGNHAVHHGLGTAIDSERLAAKASEISDSVSFTTSYIQDGAHAKLIVSPVPYSGIPSFWVTAFDVTA
jgi:hypothetical protein